jgi:hypothetical protein
MARKRYKPEEIVGKLRQVDVLVSQGQDMADAIRQIGVSEVKPAKGNPADDADVTGHRRGSTARQPCRRNWLLPNTYSIRAALRSFLPKMAPRGGGRRGQARS